jgi:quercetin dioxygenase-like cupin family protein
MPIEIRRFGVGNRRPDGPPGTHGVTAQIIHADGRGLVAELAFARGAAIEPHVNPNTSWFVVIEGGGWVGVGDERTRVAAGEAVLWPADVPHGAWTEHSEMRVIMVEFAGADDAIIGGFLETHAQEMPGGTALVSRGEGSLRDEPWRRRASDPDAGEPA